MRCARRSVLTSIALEVLDFFTADAPFLVTSSAVPMEGHPLAVNGFLEMDGSRASAFRTGARHSWNDSGAGHDNAGGEQSNIDGDVVPHITSYLELLGNVSFIPSPRTKADKGERVMTETSDDDRPRLIV